MSTLTADATLLRKPAEAPAIDIHPSPNDGIAARSMLALGGLILIAVLLVARTAMQLLLMTCETWPTVAFGHDGAVVMMVRENQAGTVAFRPGSVAVDRILLDQPPAHGVAAPHGATGFVYRPAHGFKGRDVFAFSVRGRSAAKRGTTTFRVSIKAILTPAALHAIAFPPAPG